MTEQRFADLCQPLASEYDAVVVGAGFSGMYMLLRLRELGLSVRAFETGDGVGGTWYWNRYPGCRVDIDSLSYSYWFDDELQKEWHWTYRYAPQDELLAYAEHVADRFDLRRDIQFETTVTSAKYDQVANRWWIDTDRADRTCAKYLITAVGCLSATNIPDFEGIESFSGKWYHTSRWPKNGIDFTGMRVGVIGTGSTGVQLIPCVARQADHLFVFQRTPHYALPRAEALIDPAYEQDFKEHHNERRERARYSAAGTTNEWPLSGRLALETPEEERDLAFEQRWGMPAAALRATFDDIRSNLDANETLAEFIRRKIRETVEDPDVAELLSPRDYPFGAKRVCYAVDYYETYNRENVTLVGVRTNPVDRIGPSGLVLADGTAYELDALVFATGFDAITGPLLRMWIVGRDGLTLAKKWEAGPRTYLGLSAASFPNLFMITGPGSPSVLSNMLSSIEQHVEWIADAIKHLQDEHLETMEATTEAEDAWVDHVDELGQGSIYQHGSSWYLGANIPGKPRILMPYVGGVGTYRRACERVVSHDYEGFVKT